MNHRVKILAGSIALTLSMTAVSAAEETDSEDAYQKRLALSQEIKKYRAMRKRLPVPPPAGLFGVYSLPDPGQFITGINYQHYEFDGLIQGGDSISAEQAVATAPNRFFGNPMQPPTLRVVSSSAKADVAFPFINYSYDDRISLVALAPLIKKSNVLETFNAPGTASLGTKEVNSSGLGDIKFGVLYKAYSAPENSHNLIIDAVLSAPTGSIKVEDDNLTPMNTIVKSRLAYGMQLGSGTWDALVGVAYWGKEDRWGWGAQYLATIPLEGENSEGWRYGDKHETTAWVSYEWEPTLVSSLRLRHEYQDKVKGIDPKIYGPGLGANPDNYGGEKLELSIGANWMYATARNLSFEYVIPIQQDRNGVQADQSPGVMISWRNAFF